MLDSQLHHYHATNARIGWNKDIWNMDLAEFDAHLRSDTFDVSFQGADYAAGSTGPGHAAGGPDLSILPHASVSGAPSGGVIQLRPERSGMAWQDLALDSLESNGAPRDHTVVRRP